MTTKTVATYLVTGVRGKQFVEFKRTDPISAYATKRRLVAQGWLVDVSDPYQEAAESSRRMRAAQAVRP